MPLGRRLHDFKEKHLRKESHLAPDSALPSSSQITLLPLVPFQDAEARFDACSPSSIGASTVLVQTTNAGESRTSSDDLISSTNSKNLWDRAYERLKAQDGRLIAEFERILTENLQMSHASQALALASLSPRLQPDSPCSESPIKARSSEEGYSQGVVRFAKVGTLQRQVQMKTLLDEKIKVDEEAVWKFGVGGNQVIVRDQLDKVVKVIAAAKDFVGATVASEPHATLAWTGICTLLPVNGVFPPLL